MKRIALGLLIALTGLVFFSQSARANGWPTTMSTGYDINDELHINPTTGAVGQEWCEIWGLNYDESDNLLLTINLFANFREAGYDFGGYIGGTYYSTHVFAGDLGIDVDRNGSYEYALTLANHESHVKGTLYGGVTSWYDNRHYHPPSIWGEDTQGIVAAANGYAVGTGGVSWNTVGGYPTYRIDLTLDVRDFLPEDFGGDDGWGKVNLYWSCSSAHCDDIRGPIDVYIPEPGTWFLLGSGLLGLAAFGRKKRLDVS